MHCWNCGTRNPDENAFCGRCGKRIASMSAANTPSAPTTADVAPLQANPLVEEPRAVHDSPREIAQAEVTPVRAAETVPPSGPVPVNLRPTEEKRVREKEIQQTEIAAGSPSSPIEMPRRDTPTREVQRTRITGPSFLGLSDESTGTGSSDYLLYDDEPERSSWRGWLAFAVLVLLAFLVYKQWNAVSSGAQMLAQRATGEDQKPAPAKPAPAVSDTSDANNTASDNAPASTDSQSAAANATTPPPPADAATSSATNKDGSVNKPEADHTEDASASGTKESEAAAKSNDTSVAEDSVTPAPAKEEKKQAADEEDSRTAAANAATKATTPAEPKFNDSQIEEAQRYLTGQGGTRQDCGRAISLLRSSAREGNPRAQVKLGALYATGQCVTQDRAAAYEWLARAQETQPHNGYLQRTMSSLWANMTPEERNRITK